MKQKETTGSNLKKLKMGYTAVPSTQAGQRTPWPRILRRRRISWSRAKRPEGTRSTPPSDSNSDQSQPVAEDTSPSSAEETTNAAATLLPSTAPIMSHSDAYNTAIEILQSRGETDTEAAHRAYTLLDAERTRASDLSPPSPGSPPDEDKQAAAARLTRLTAGALLSWIRCATDGNGLVVSNDGKPVTADTEERRKLWGEHAPKVLALVEEVGTDPALDPEVTRSICTAHRPPCVPFFTGSVTCRWTLSWDVVPVVITDLFPSPLTSMLYIGVRWRMLREPNVKKKCP